MRMQPGSRSHTRTSFAFGPGPTCKVQTSGEYSGRVLQARAPGPDLGRILRPGSAGPGSRARPRANTQVGFCRSGNSGCTLVYFGDCSGVALGPVRLLYIRSQRLLRQGARPSVSRVECSCVCERDTRAGERIEYEAAGGAGATLRACCSGKGSRGAQQILASGKSQPMISSGQHSGGLFRMQRRSQF